MITKAQQQKRELLHEAIRAFEDNTGIRIDVIAQEHPIGGGQTLDALADIALGDKTKTYAIELKTNLNNATVALAAQQLAATYYKGLLIADYVNPAMAERLREQGLAFIDLAGNAYLNEPPVFVFIKGNKRQETGGKHLKPTEALRATGLKLIFGLLVAPKIINKSYREIADLTDVALGTVAGVMTDLKNHGYVYEGERGDRRLINTQGLIQEWVIAYPDKLRPKLRFDTYRAAKPGWWRGVDPQRFSVQWGGEVAAERMTKYLKPEKATVYAIEKPIEFIARNRLATDPAGNVEILKRFWTKELMKLTDPNDDGELVPPLLVYADLMASGDARNIETANMIYADQIDGHLGHA